MEVQKSHHNNLAYTVALHCTDYEIDILKDSLATMVSAQGALVADSTGMPIEAFKAAVSKLKGIIDLLYALDSI